MTMKERTFKKADLLAPRYRPDTFKVMNHPILRTNPLRQVKKTSYWHRLFAQYPHLKKYTKKQIRNYIIRFNREQVMTEILNSRYGVDLPGNMGVMFLGTLYSTSSVCSPINLLLSSEVGEKVPWSYIESCNNVGHIFYTNYTKKIKFENARYWGFQSDRVFNRGIRDIYPANWNRYMTVKKLRYISSLLRKQSAKEYIDKITEGDRKEYDELKFITE